MASALDLQEQEQIDQLKAFWAQWGNAITALLVAGALSFAAWNGWNWYQREQGAKASVLFDELERSVSAADVDKASRVIGDLRRGFAGTVWAGQAALAVAKLQYDTGKVDEAQASLKWVVDNGANEALKAMAALRLAAVLLDRQDAQGALALLAGEAPPGFEALWADRRGDALQLKGDRTEAVAAYKKALASMASGLEYRGLIEAKLTALGESAK